MFLSASYLNVELKRSGIMLPSIFVVLAQHFASLTLTHLRYLTIRGIRNPGFRQCLGFCTADFWSSLAYESAEQKNQTLPNSRIPDTSVDYRMGHGVRHDYFWFRSVNVQYFKLT